MFTINYKKLTLKKRFPLKISRGTRYESENLFIEIVKDGLSGYGEMAPVGLEGATTPEDGQVLLEQFIKELKPSMAITDVYDFAMQWGLPMCVLAALDIAIWDWTGKKKSLPLYEVLGAGMPTAATSVTVGMTSKENLEHRLPILLSDPYIGSVKIKLGSSDGIEADKEMFTYIVNHSAVKNKPIRVDANGGWSVSDALLMMRWLAQTGCEYIEQPLKQGEEEGLPHLYKNRPLPLYIDESCQTAEDVEKWAHCVDGVNMKLMKCGGITGAMRIIQLARKHKLKTMIGCMSESSLAISAGASVSGLIDYIDLDSHLNLEPDPCTGAALVSGIVTPNNSPGHGASLKGDSHGD